MQIHNNVDTSVPSFKILIDENLQSKRRSFKVPSDEILNFHCLSAHDFSMKHGELIR
jgi:hypothetical protein